jgi:hypothetical protein
MFPERPARKILYMLKFREIEEKRTMQEEWRTKLERFGNLEDNKTREAMDKRPMDQRVVE